MYFPADALLTGYYELKHLQASAARKYLCGPKMAVLARVGQQHPPWGNAGEDKRWKRFETVLQMSGHSKEWVCTALKALKKKKIMEMRGDLAKRVRDCELIAKHQECSAEDRDGELWVERVDLNEWDGRVEGIEELVRELEDKNLDFDASAVMISSWLN